MDAIDILGGLFGRKRGGSGGAPDLSEIFGRKPQAPANQRGSSTDPRDIDAQAKELEDILNVGRKREEQEERQVQAGHRSGVGNDRQESERGIAGG